MSEIEIKKATLSDIKDIKEVVLEVWPVAYHNIITTEQIAYMLKMMYDDASLQKQMEEQGCDFLLAKRNNTIVGFSSHSKTEEGLFKLHKLYIHLSEQGKGTGKKLLEEVCVRSKKQGGMAIELQVNKKNTPAITFYSKNNFLLDREAVFEIGSGFVMDDYIMKRLL